MAGKPGFLSKEGKVWAVKADSDLERMLKELKKKIEEQDKVNKELQVKLMEQESVNKELMAGKFEELYNDLKEKKEPKKTYAQASSGEASRPFAVIIEPVDGGNESAEQLEKMVKHQVKQADKSIRIRKVKKINQKKVIVECDKDADRKELIAAIDKGKKMQARVPKGLNPQVMIHNIDLDIPKEEIISNIRRYNPNIDFWVKNEDDIKLVFEKNNRNGWAKFAVITVTPEIFEAIVRAKFQIYMPGVCLAANQFLSVRQCTKCCRYGHLKKECKHQNEVCGDCGQDGHEARDCKAKEYNCCNCEHANKFRSNQTPQDHSAFHSRCHVYLQKKEQLEQQINYVQ